MKIVVVGGGVVGLTTALQLQENFRNTDITVIARDFDNIVSYVAAGIFRIGRGFIGPSENITQQWIKDSYDYYDCIRKSEDSLAAGVTSISGYMFANSQPVTCNYWMKKVVPIYRRAEKEEFQLVGGNWKYGSFFMTLLTQPNYYLPWARQKLIINGTKFVKKEIHSLAEIKSDYDIIFNCTGFGAREICNDHRMVAIRGQVAKIIAPWIKTFFYAESDTYIIPGCDGNVTLGGSRNFDCEKMDVCPYESIAIRERCGKLIPSIKTAKIIREKVGLRPHRENNVRVEIERCENFASKSVVIHNYGHGGYGVCTAPGTSKYATELAINFHKSSNANL